MSRLAGLRILVTGAAGGIGAAIAERLARDGAEVVASDRALATGIACDITDRAAVEAMFARAGPLWGVVHAAALCGGSGPFHTVAPEAFARYIDTNLTGAFHVLQCAAQGMIAGQRPGRLVAVGSVNAIAAERDASPYVASKGGLRMLVKAAAVDLARHGILANLVHPGPITVARNARLFAEPHIRQGFARSVPLGQAGTPASVAGAVAHFLDPDNSFTTGAELSVDGGVLAYLP